jgi:hypothetical protein
VKREKLLNDKVYTWWNNLVWQDKDEILLNAYLKAYPEYFKDLED